MSPLIDRSAGEFPFFTIITAIRNAATVLPRLLTLRFDKVAEPDWIVIRQYQPERQSRSWARTVKEQRKRVLLRIKRTPSLKHVVDNSDWVAEAWADAVAKAVEETGLDVFPEDCPWTMTDVLSENWLPNAS